MPQFSVHGTSQAATPSSVRVSAIVLCRVAVGGVLLFSVMGCGQGGAESLPPLPPERHVATGSTPPAHQNARLPSEQPRKTSARPIQPDDWFENVAEQSGVNFAYRDGESGFYQLLSSVGGGAAWLDYDGDNDMDLFITGGGYLTGPPIVVHGASAALFRNDGDGQFTDVTSAAGLNRDELYTHGCTVGDFDRDGDPDVFVAGYGGVQLFRNEAGSGFVEVAHEAGLGRCHGWNVIGAWLDFDRDGWLDLYIVTYADWRPDAKRTCLNDRDLRDVCGPTFFPGSRDMLWRNCGDGTFENVSDRAGLVERNRGLGVVVADFDEDGWIDVFVANDVEANNLYMGRPALPFLSEGEVAGVAYSPHGEREGSMGVDAGDYNGDGLLDLWYLNYANQDNSLCRRTSAGFLPAGDIVGLTGRSRPWVGFGTALVDFNHDGWDDIFVANGHVAYDRRDSPYFQPAQLFVNRNGERFVEVSDQGGPYFDLTHAGRGAALGDFDDDGALDLVVSHQNDPVAVLRNRLENPHWVRVKLRGVESNIDAIGAKLSAPYGSRRLHRWVRSGSGYCSSFDPRVLFPQPDASPVDVTVHWPSGRVETFPQLVQERTHELVEGMGQQ